MIKTKYPVILVHGMIIKNHPIWPAFRGITDFLKKKNVDFYMVHMDGFGSVETCARQLKENVLEVMEKEHCDKVNIIAHSKGGIDARYMISCLGMADHVASLSTLCAPHRGSKSFVHLLKMPPFWLKLITGSLNIVGKLLGDKKPDSLQIAKDLTPEAMARFNEVVLDAPGVYYQSFTAVPPEDISRPILLPHRLTSRWEGTKTDGLVTQASCEWGNYRGPCDKPFDHFYLGGNFGHKKNLAYVGRFYRRIIRELQTMGF